MRRDANAITAEDGEGTTHIPSATIGVLSLESCAPTGAAEGACAAAHPHVRGALYG
ncbi:CRISPR-associated protein Cas1, partial [Thermobifida fusca TM51]